MHPRPPRTTGIIIDQTGIRICGAGGAKIELKGPSLTITNGLASIEFNGKTVSINGQRFTIVGVLKEAETGVSIAELMRRHGISKQTYFRWKSKYGGASVKELTRLRELMEDNKHVASAMRKAHEVCDEHDDVASASLLEVFIDETERRTWFLFEASRQEGSNAA